MGAALDDVVREFRARSSLVLPGLGDDGGGVVDPTQIGGVSTPLFDQDAAGRRRGEVSARTRWHEERLAPFGTSGAAGRRVRW